MGIDAVGSADSVNYVANSNDKNRNNNLRVDTETFMQLLVAQMQYQDPLEPQSNTDFVAQLAQLTSLEQMQSMGGSLNVTQAMGFVGRQIYAEILNSESGETEAFAGIVDSVIMQSGDVYVVTDGNAIPIENVLMVSEVAVPQQTQPADPANPEIRPETEAADVPEAPRNEAVEGI